MESKMNKESDQNVASSSSNSNRSRSKDGTQRSRNIRLPTPPPDPTAINNDNTQSLQQNANEPSTPQIDFDDAMNKESELLEYILSISSQKSPTTSEGDGKQPPLLRTNSLFSQVIAADEAFDHLDKLYKLMEQLLNLREQNSKLQKRVRDLEHLKKLQDMNLKINFNPDDKIILQDLEADPGYAESLLDNILAAGRNASQKRNSKYKPARLRQSILGRPQERSCSVAMDDSYSPYHNNMFTYSDVNIYSTNKSPSCVSKPAKVSKWKKVKAAFKWEKASSTVGGGHLPVAKSQDSGLGLPIINNEVAKYLRVPSITAAGHSGGSSGGGVSPADSVLSGQSSPGGIRTSGKDLSISVPETPASLSSASSMEDIQNHEVDKSQKDISIEKPNRQRFSTCSDEESLQDQRRSKSFDEDTILGKDEDNIYYTKHWNYKMHKTPWGKVKDIIQTRKDSLKKSRVRINSKAMDDNNMNSEHGVSPNRTHRRSDSNIDVCSFSSEEFPDVFESPPADPVTVNFDSIQRRSSANVSNDNPVNIVQNLQTKRQMPSLTVTISNSEADNSIKTSEISSTSDKKNNLPPEVVQRYQDIIRAEKIRPSYRHNSRWHRVKKAFLNKNLDNTFRNVEYKSLSTPASPTRNSSFFSEDSDGNSALKEYLTYHSSRNKSPQSISSQRHLQEEIQKNYEELQNKLSLEFQEKMLEWERLKAATTSSCSSQNQNVYATATSTVNDLEDSQATSELDSTRKAEDCDKIKPRSPNTSKFKENSTSPITSSDNLSAEFKKKLQEWQRIKKEQSTGQSTPTNLQHSASTKKRITDNFQFFKAGTTATPRVDDSKTFRYPDTKQLSEDFLKKLEEWKHMKATNTVPSYSGYREEDDENLKHYADAKPSSPGFKRKETSLGLKSPRQSAKKSKFHEHKELHILEKEIQKIEREKQRLEREREKYLEREERLAKLRRSIGGHQAKKEVLVQTSTGFFRFQGISRKFTQRLYEWEKARGIGPEESTLTLLSPSYKSILPRSNTRKAEDINQSQSQGRLVRSKSMDSVANLTSNQMTTSITHQPSSLSLNDMEELEAECLAEAHVDSIPDHLPDIDTFEEPEAVIVDVEAVEEETAAPLEENVAIPVCVTHTPVYRYEQQQDDRLCEGEECLAPKVQGGDSTKTQSSYHLIEENITLLNKLKDKEEICKQLESDIEDIEGEMNDIEKTHNELEKLDSDSESAKKKQCKLQELERKKRRLRNEGVNLHNSFTEHKAQQTLIAQHLVGSMRRLQEINTSVALNVPKKEISSSNQQLMDVTEMVQDLSSELLLLAEKLQSFLNQRNNENVKTKHHIGKKLTREKQWRSVDLSTESTTIIRKTRENSADASELANLLTNKILELKRGLSYICAASDLTAPRPNKKTVKRKKYNSTSNETLSTNKDKIMIEKSDSVPNVTLSRKCDIKNDDIKVKAEVKRKTRTRSKNDLKYSESDDDNFDENTKKLNRLHKSHKKSPNESTSSNKSLGNLNHNINETVTIKNVLVDTNPQFVKYENNFRSNSPVDVLVKTTKTVFLPDDSNFETKESANEPDIQTLRYTNENGPSTSHICKKDVQEDTSFPMKKDMSPIHSPTSLLQRRLFKSRTCSLACDENSPSTSNKQDLDNNATENISDQPRNLLRKTLSSDAVASSLPPLPHSPTPLRRDRGLTKETAPSIRLMIARYNQRLYEQDGGKSPGGSSGSGSPVAWRSPVLERRVRAQTEKYQEEIKRVLQQGSWKKNEITKSASVGFIQTTVVPPKKPQTSMEAFVKISEIPDTPPSQRKLRGILKSSSAGSLKIDNQAKEIISNNSRLTELSKSDDKKPEKKLDEHPIPVEKPENIAKATMHVRSLSVTNTPPKIVRKYDMRSVSPKVQISSSPESTQNSPNSLRALKIQRAKEDFLARQISSPEFSSPKSESCLDEESKKQNRCHFDVNYVTVPHRLSQVSCGSESSCDNSKPDGYLIKSASAGMINIDANTYRQLAASEMHSQGYVSLPRSNRSHKDILGGKFGISSITSKFRKVKMRRHKDKEGSKLNTISMLCRQSLFVDINDNSGELLNNTNNIPSTNQDYPPVERARSKSTSSSPAFQRHLSDSNKSSSTSGAKSKIFKSKQ